MKIITRAAQESSEKKLKFAGADHVVMPDKIGGSHMSAMVVNKDLVEFIDNLTLGGNKGTNIQELTFENVFHGRDSCSILEVNMRSKTGCTIIGYRDPQGTYTVNPDANTVIERGSKLVVIGNSTQIEHLRQVYKLKA